MKRLLTLHQNIIQDMGDLLGVDPTRDIETLISRFQEEGDGFLTITLPSLEQAILAALASGKLDPSSTPSFRWRRGLPVFLRGFLDLVFLPGGHLRSDASADAVFALRQMTAVSKKIERRVSPYLEEKAEQAFRTTDSEVPETIDHFDSESLSHLKTVFLALFRRVLSDANGAIASFSLLPRHGPGSVAERISAEEKWMFPSWLESLEDSFPSTLYAHHNGTRAPILAVAPEHEPPVRVSFVPKTVRGPRVIAIEPYARQYAQQALARKLYALLRRDWPDSLDLFDQTRNQALAAEGSRDGNLSTLDLSEASDRLANCLVLFLTEEFNHLHDALIALRSGKALLPSGDTITLRKFASMGSALTFPIQSMVFFAIAVAASCEGAYNGPGEIRKIAKAKRISVFGDDIIVPSEHYHATIRFLERMRLKVNVSKSFGSGNFRESCGGDYFKGTDVTIVRIRRDVPDSVRDAQGVSSLASFRNLCYMRGMWRTARRCDLMLSRIVPWKPVPVGHTSIGRWTVLPVTPDYVREDLQLEMIKRPKLIPIGNKYQLEGQDGLFKWLLEKESSGEPVSPFETLERPTAFAIHSRGSMLEVRH